MAPAKTPRPINMILHCPACHEQHIDAASEGWVNPPHRSHLCANPGCQTIWRPADVPTNGVAAIKTRGRLDSERQPSGIWHFAKGRNVEYP